MMKIQDAQIYVIGSLDMSIYKCISKDYVTDQVIMTEKQLAHIKEHHPEAYENAISYLGHILKQPDYIIKDKEPNTGLVIKNVVACEKYVLLVLRICTSCKEGYQNSITRKFFTGTHNSAIIRYNRRGYLRW